MNNEYSWLVWALPAFFIMGTIFFIFFLLFLNRGIPKDYKSDAKIYWVLWLVFVVVFLLGKIFKIYLLKDVPFERFLFCVWMILVPIYGVAVMKVFNYLEKNHYEKWKELTTVSISGLDYISFRNVKVFKFLLSKDALNDPVVAYLKSEVKKIALLCIVCILSFPIFFIIVICFKL